MVAQSGCIFIFSSLKLDSDRSIDMLKKLYFLKLQFHGFTCKMEFDSLYFPMQGIRPGFFHDDKAQKKGAGLLRIAYVSSLVQLDYSLFICFIHPFSM